MSLKALQRRAREAEHWLGQRALPLWAEVGFVREGGVVSGLEFNHRPADPPIEGDRAAQLAMADLLALAPYAGFDTARAEALRARALAAADTAAEPAVTSLKVAARSIEAACDDLRLRLQGLAVADGEEAVLSRLAARRAFDKLMDEFLTPDGGWIPGYDASGLPMATEIPARLAGPIAAALGPLLAFAEA